MATRKKQVKEKKAASMPAPDVLPTPAEVGVPPGMIEPPKTPETPEAVEPPRPEFDALAFVVQGITDRDAAGLYGLVPERDLFRLWEDKVECAESTTQLQGDLLADVARERFLETIATREPLRLQSACFVQNKAMPFMRALIDGLDLANGFLIRVATQSREDFERVQAGHLPTRAGRVPERYWVEIQHQLTVSGIEKAYFVSTIDGSQVASCVVKRDLVFTSNHVAKCIDFWDHVRRSVPPADAVIPPDVDPDSIGSEVDLNQLPLTGIQNKEGTTV